MAWTALPGALPRKSQPRLAAAWAIIMDDQISPLSSISSMTSFKVGVGVLRGVGTGAPRGNTAVSPLFVHRFSSDSSSSRSVRRVASKWEIEASSSFNRSRRSCLISRILHRISRLSTVQCENVTVTVVQSSLVGNVADPRCPLAQKICGIQKRDGRSPPQSGQIPTFWCYWWWWTSQPL